MIYYLTGTIILMLVGVVGVVIPIVPGIPLMAILALIFHFLVSPLPLWSLIIIIVIACLSVLVDYLSGLLGSRLAGANLKSMLLGFAGMLIGLISFPPLGAIIGLFVGILIGEVVSNKDSKKAIKTATVGVISTLAGIAVNFVLALTLMVIFIVGAL